MMHAHHPHDPPARRKREATPPSSGGTQGSIHGREAREIIKEAVSAEPTAKVNFAGVEVLPTGKRRTLPLAACEKIFEQEFAGRILPFDEGAARYFPKSVASRRAQGLPISQMDAMIASIVLSRRAALATRNTGDFEHTALRLINPWLKRSAYTPQQ